MKDFFNMEKIVPMKECVLKIVKENCIKKHNKNHVTMIEEYLVSRRVWSP